MLFKEYKDSKEWNRQVYGIKVPPLHLPTVYPEIVIVPLLCFNPKTKQRLGYGGGYYDQYIKHSKKSNKKTVFVGIGY
jgi:5,10-methenyltetrahydrofolate synthetase